MKTKNIWSRLLFTPIFINYVNHAGVYETVWGYPHVIVNLPNFKVSSKKFVIVLVFMKSRKQNAQSLLQLISTQIFTQFCKS